MLIFFRFNYYRFQVFLQLIIIKLKSLYVFVCFSMDGWICGKKTTHKKGCHKLQCLQQGSATYGLRADPAHGVILSGLRHHSGVDLWSLRRHEIPSFWMSGFKHLRPVGREHLFYTHPDLASTDIAFLAFSLTFYMWEFKPHSPLRASSSPPIKFTLSIWPSAPKVAGP